MTALVFFSSNFKDGFSIFDAEYQELILGVAQGVVSKKEIAKFFRQARISAPEKEIESFFHNSTHDNHIFHL